MKPIEEGCLALIINSQLGNSGIVTVGKFIGRNSIHYNNDLWEVDRQIKYTQIHKNKTTEGFGYFAPEANLLRIDGEEFEDDFEQEKIKEYINE